MTITTNEDTSNNEPSNQDIVSLQKKIAGLEKRLSDTQSYSDKRFNETASERDEALARIAELEAQRVPTNMEEWNKLKQSDPTTYEAIQQAIAAQSVKDRSSIAKELELLKKASSKRDAELTFNEVKSYHKDLDEIRRSTEFEEWLNGQSKYVQEAFSGKERATAEDFKFFIDKFKHDSNWKKTETAKTSKQKEIEDSLGVEGRRSTVPADDDVEYMNKKDWDNMDLAYYKKHREEIYKKISEGKLVIR